MDVREQMQQALDAIREGRPQEGAQLLRDLGKVAPSQPAIWANLGNAEREMGDLSSALRSYAHALRLARGGPDEDWIWSNYLMTQCYREPGEGRTLWQLHQEWGRSLPPATEPAWRQQRDPHRRLHVGLVSGDLRWHSVAFFLLALLRHLDPHDCEITCFSNHPDRDEMTDILRSQVSAWVDIHAASNPDVLQRIRRSRVDVLVDLSGHSAYNRMAVFAQRAAPVQISWLGYPVPTGNPAIDFWITDSVICPPSDPCPWQGSRPLRLAPGCHAYHAPLPETAMPLERLSDAARPVTLGSFNHRAKLSPETLRMWAEILKAAPQARLLLKSRCYTEVENREQLWQQMEQLGVVRERIDLWSRTPSTREHLDAYRQIDIALDTYPYAGTTTTFESLWMGVPVVTRFGSEPASRVGASILRQLGCSDWVSKDRQAYVEAVLRWIAEDGQRTRFRMEARERLRSSGLTDGERFARSWQASIRNAWCAYLDRSR